VTEQQTKPKLQTTDDSIIDFANNLMDQYRKDIEQHSLGYLADGNLTLHYCIVRFLRLKEPQPKNLDDLDKSMIDFLSKYRSCSIGEIAFVLDRSKSTISEYLNHTKGTE
jgi:hypothetical protein